MKHSLKSSEWLLATSLLVLIASLVWVAHVNAKQASSAIATTSLVREAILVTIDGAVKKPGLYSVPLGTTVGQIVRKAKPTRDANLKLVPCKEVVDAPLHLTIEPLEEIRVVVTGAIAETLEVTLPPGSRISDLKSKVIFTQETEKTFFRRKKLLKDGDQIVVPKKTVE